MSDTKLQELARAWKSGHPVSPVPYLRELLRTGEVRYAEAALAWRLRRIEAMLSGAVTALIPMRDGMTSFDPERPEQARMVLEVLYDGAPGLVIPGTPAVASKIGRGELVRPICIAGSSDVNDHLGPINYDLTLPVCERCDVVVVV